MRSVGDALLIAELSWQVLLAKARAQGYAGEPITRAVLDHRGLWVEFSYVPRGD